MDPKDYEGPGMCASREVSERCKRQSDFGQTIDPKGMARVIRRPPPAENAFGTLRDEQQAFEAKLDNEHEIAMRIFGGASLIHVHTIRFDSPDVLLFDGFTPEGDETLDAGDPARRVAQSAARESAKAEGDGV